MRRFLLTTAQIGLAVLLAGGCSSAGTAGSHTSERSSAGATQVAMAPPCPSPHIDLVVGSTVEPGTRLPTLLHGPFSSVGVSFGQQTAGMKITSARLDVVDRRQQPPGANGVVEAGPSAAAAAQQQLIAGSEAGVVARSQLTTFRPGQFVVPLTAVNKALHLSGTPHTFVPPSRTAYPTPFASVPTASSTPAGGYEVYLVMQYVQSSCLPKATNTASATTAAHGVVDLATLLP